MTTQPADRIWFAQMLRGIAVILVIIEHMFIGLWINPAAATGTLLTDPPDFSATEQFYMPFALWLIGNDLVLGNIGVAMFFLISGFVIPISLERLSPGRFAVARIFRLYPVWIACMAILALTLWIHSAVKGNAVPFTATDWAANLLLVQDWLGDPYINPVVWTLVIELKFYALCLLLAFFGGLRRSWPFLAIMGALTLFTLGANSMITDRIVAGEVGVAIVIGVVAHTTPFMCFMFMGVCVYNLFRRHWSPAHFCLAAGALMAMFLVSVRGGVAPDIWQRQVLLAFSIGAALFGAAYLARAHLPHSRVLNFSADISYPLYATHYVTGGIIMLALYRIHPIPILNAIEAIALMVALSWLVHRYVEVPGTRLGKRVTLAPLLARLRRRGARPAPEPALEPQPVAAAALDALADPSPEPSPEAAR